MSLIKRYLYWLLLAAWLASLVAAWWCGADNVRRDWQLAKSQAAANLSARVAAAESRARDAEYQAAQKVAAAETRYQEQYRENIQSRDRTIAELRSGQRRMYVAIAAASAGSASPTGDASTPATETRAELSPEAGEFFIRIGSEADEVVNELNYCIDRLAALP